MKKSFTNDINEINKNIKEAERLLKESMSFYEDDSLENDEIEEEPIEDEFDNEIPEDDSLNNERQMENINSVESYVDHIRKYSLNGLSALCDNPESEEYQMLKKIFQMCDKKTEKKENMTESKRLFGVLKENKNVIFETYIDNKQDFKKFKSTLVSETIKNGFDPSKVRLVSENKLIR